LAEFATADAEDDVDQLLLGNGTDDQVAMRIIEDGTFSIDVISDGTPLAKFLDPVFVTTQLLVHNGGNSEAADTHGQLTLHTNTGDTPQMLFSEFATASARIGMPDGDLVSIVDPTNSFQWGFANNIFATDIDGLLTDINMILNGDGDLSVDGSMTAGTSFIIGAADMSETDLEQLDGITPGTAAASKALVLDASLDVATINNLTATQFIGGGGSVTGVTAVDFALTADADAGDFDIDSLDRLEFFDAGLFIDGGTDGTLLVSSDGTLELASADWDISTTGTITNTAYDSDNNTLTNVVEDDCKDGSDLVRSAIEFVIDGGGSAITTGIKGDLEVPFNCTIQRVTMLADQTGTIEVDIWVEAYATFPPENGDSITDAGTTPIISAAIKYQDSSLTSWTVALTAGDIIRWNVDQAATIERCTISLVVEK